MQAQPQESPYRPDPAILALADWLGDVVEPAPFPQTLLRFRNQRWAGAIGLAGLDDAAWTTHFGRFAPLPGNLPSPLALKYHGHQFRVYNPDIGDGRGFLFAQMRDSAGRLLDCGTKGSGTTPYSRTADGRLTLKGAVREILATEMLEALGANTSKTLSVIETGEQLHRGDEPSPTRSAVLVRLSHSHIRIGTFQRLAALDMPGEMAALIAYCLEHFPGPPPPETAPGRDQPAAILLHQVVERLADLAASYIVAGFVHGVLNTDNMNITGESFDYGPWRWLPRWDGGFTAAYFDHQGLYAFGRQGEAIRWNCAQLAMALSMVCDTPPLVAALDRFGECFEQALARRFCARLGVASAGDSGTGLVADLALFAQAQREMRETGTGPDAWFHAMRGGGMDDPAWRELLHSRARPSPMPEFWREERPVSLLIEEVEALWEPIASHDDWSALEGKVSEIRRLGEAMMAG